jgi:hypothetical protein
MLDDDSLPTDARTDRWPISRRQFIRLSAVTAGAIGVSGNAVALSSQKPTDLYEFVATHVESDFAIPTLIELSSPTGFDELRALGHDLVTTTHPSIAAYTTLRPDAVSAVNDVESVKRLRYSPGSNPFWRLGYYPEGVFPSVNDSVDFIDFEQCVDGMQHLQSSHDDRMRVSTIGKSPGHYNLFLDEPGPKNLWTVEVTNDIHDEEDFREKEKVVFSLSIHGDERSGAEAGTRFIERLLDGRESEIEALLDDIVLVFLYPNPDGWVARDPRYQVESNNDDDSKPEPSTFKRTTATGVDPNRQYPTVGWIDAMYHPAEPNGSDLQDDAPGIDSDVPAEYVETVPDALDIVEYLRGYENLAVGSDLHGKFTSTDFINGLIVNDQYDTDEFHAIYEWNRQTENRVEATLGERLDSAQDRFEALNREYGESGGFEGSTLPTPEEGYSYGTILDTIGYTTTGTLISWMSQPEAQGGLGVQMMAHEMGWDNRFAGRIAFRPWLVGLQVDGYLEVIRTTAEHAVRNVTATIQTGNTSTAYVDTDALTRSSDALSFGDATRRTQTTSATVGAKPETVSVDVPSTAKSLSLTVTPSAGVLMAKLRAPDGAVVRTFNPASSDSNEGIAEWMVDSPTSGDWTIDLKSRGGSEATATVTSAVLVSDNTIDAPDPKKVLGYSQRPYSVTPLAYFPDYAEDIADHRGSGRGHGNGNRNENGNGNITESMVGLAVDEIADGALFRGKSDRLAVENLVVTHDEGRDVSEYVAALDAFVAAGGNLVLTDRGVRLLCVMSNDRVADIAPDDVVEIELFSAYLGERVEDHPLLADTRPIQRELWKAAPLGYPISRSGTAPLTVIETEAFSAANGSVAGYSFETPPGSSQRKRYVAAGSFTSKNGNGDDTGVHVIGGLLPPAKQSSLHPFGMLEYTATFLGHTMLTNALGYQQKRFVNGERVATFGELE